jgi:hypothetical protein
MERVNYNKWSPFREKQGGDYVKCKICGFDLLQDDKKRQHCSYMKCKFSGGKEIMIKLDRKYFLKASSHGWDIGVFEPRKQKDGEMKDVFVPEFHYSTIRSAMVGYVKYKQMDAEKAGKIESFTDLFNITKLLDKKIESLFIQIDEGLKNGKYK